MRERSVQELADLLPISRPAVSRHLRVLKRAGLVVERPARDAPDLPAPRRGRRGGPGLHGARVGRGGRPLPARRGEHEPAPVGRVTARRVIEPIRLAFDVDCPVEHAFETWTGRIGQWWPLDHTVSAEPGLTVVLEGRAGGRIFERETSGVEHDWGEVTIWEPPTRLAYTWHLNARSRPMRPRSRSSSCPAGEALTRVEIEHRDWERLGAGPKPGGSATSVAGRPSPPLRRGRTIAGMTARRPPPVALRVDHLDQLDAPARIAEGIGLAGGRLRTWSTVRHVAGRPADRRGRARDRGRRRGRHRRGPRGSRGRPRRPGHPGPGSRLRQAGHRDRRRRPGGPGRPRRGERGRSPQPARRADQRRHDPARRRAADRRGGPGRRRPAPGPAARPGRLADGRRRSRSPRTSCGRWASR